MTLLLQDFERRMPYVCVKFSSEDFCRVSDTANWLHALQFPALSFSESRSCRFSESGYNAPRAPRSAQAQSIS